MKLKMNFGENSLGNKITEVWCYGLTVTPRPPAKIHVLKFLISITTKFDGILRQNLQKHC